MQTNSKLLKWTLLSGVFASVPLHDCWVGVSGCERTNSHSVLSNCLQTQQK